MLERVLEDDAEGFLVGAIVGESGGTAVGIENRERKVKAKADRCYVTVTSVWPLADCRLSWALMYLHCIHSR